MSDTLSDRRASGHFEVIGWWGEVQEGDTLSCVHCQATWVKQRGSGKLRGFCQKCSGFVCGPGCAECVPWERKIENMECGRPVNTPLPESVSVPGRIELIVPGE